MEPCFQATSWVYLPPAIHCFKRSLQCVCARVCVLQVHVCEFEHICVCMEVMQPLPWCSTFLGK